MSANQGLLNLLCASVIDGCLSGLMAFCLWRRMAGRLWGGMLRAFLWGGVDRFRMLRCWMLLSLAGSIQRNGSQPQRRYAEDHLPIFPRKKHVTKPHW